MAEIPHMPTRLPRRLLGAIAQWGCVVRDLDEGMAQWNRLLGVGPWIIMDRFSRLDFVFRGAPTQPDFVVAFTYFGETQIELIQQRNDARSPYKEFLDSGREGLQHFGFWPDDLETARAALTDAGCNLAFSIAQPGDGIPGALYFDSPEPFGPMIEISKPDATRQLANQALKQRAAAWDGRDPVRRFRSLLSPEEP